MSGHCNLYHDQRAGMLQVSLQHNNFHMLPAHHKCFLQNILPAAQKFYPSRKDTWHEKQAMQHSCRLHTTNQYSMNRYKGSLKSDSRVLQLQLPTAT